MYEPSVTVRMGWTIVKVQVWKMGTFGLSRRKSCYSCCLQDIEVSRPIWGSVPTIEPIELFILDNDIFLSDIFRPQCWLVLDRSVRAGWNLREPLKVPSTKSRPHQQ